MVNPRTVNVGIQVPLTGADVDTWGEDDVNPNMASIDGFIGGVQTVSVSNTPVTLTSPPGFTATPGAGPTQSENRVLRFTGALTADVRVTLPLPGAYLIDNRTTGNFVLSFQGATATEVIGTPQGEIIEIYNDGANVRFVGLDRVGAVEMWAGISSIPAWVTACTVKPYLRCDAGVYNFSDFPALAARLLGQFGGNGITTFAVPDTGGRALLGYDTTASRITVAGGAGFNGQTIGASGGSQGITLTEAQLAAHYHVAGIFDPAHSHTISGIIVAGGTATNTSGGWNTGSNTSGASVTGVRVNSSNGLDTTYSAGGGQAHGNVQPSIVVGIWVIKT